MFIWRYMTNMKFTCKQQTLSKALNTVSKAVSTRTTLPVLKGILLEADGSGRLTLSASDLDISIRKTIEADVTEPGSAVVASKLFGDIIRKLPSEMIQIEETDDKNVLIKTNSSEFNVIGLPVDDFPNISGSSGMTDKLSLDCGLFRDMIKKTSFAASLEEAKGVLVGILTEITPDNVRMVALDGFRLALSNEPADSGREEKFLIAAKIMNEISKIISEDSECETLDILLSNKKAMFIIGDTEVSLQLMEGEFIRYRDIIPADGTTVVTVGRSILLESIERASLLAREGKNNLIKMSMHNDLLTITSRSEEGNVKEEIIMEKTGDDLDIGFNSKYVTDVLKAIEDEEIKMVFSTGTSPCVIKPVTGDAFEYLVLPVRIPRV